MQEFSDQMPADITRYPMVPIRDVVIFPFTKVAFKIGRPSSVKALEQVMLGERNIFLATQHDATIDDPNPEQIYKVGTLGRILQAQKQENGQIKVVVEGRERGMAVRYEQDGEGIFTALVAKSPRLTNPATAPTVFCRKFIRLSSSFCAPRPTLIPTRCTPACAEFPPPRLPTRCRRICVSPSKKNSSFSKLSRFRNACKN
jgi:ATP-dependent Lon protease